MRVLSMEAIQKANSGHPGITMGAAPMAYELWAHHMKHNPINPEWVNRDRFVLSAGHGSMMLYSLLHLFGYKVSIDDIKNFRQFESITPGHPEHGVTPGVDASTGPLGQGFANAVGMAMAETHLASKFNTEEYKVVDHYTYALCGDGCMMEGITYEAASLAGTLGLGKLIALYDSNNITIEGSTDIAFTENVRQRFDAMNWHTVFVEDGNDIDAIGKAIEEAKSVTDKPSQLSVTALQIKQVAMHLMVHLLAKMKLRLQKLLLAGSMTKALLFQMKLKLICQKLLKSLQIMLTSGTRCSMNMQKSIQNLLMSIRLG